MVPVEDEEISKEITRLFKKRGIDVNTGAKVEKVEKTETGVKVSYTDANGKPQVKEAEKVLVAVGRAGRTDNIGLEKTEGRAGARAGQGRTKRRRRPSRASMPSATLSSGFPQLAHVGAMAGMVAVAKIAGRKVPSNAPRPHPRLHVHRSADRFGRPD